LPNATLFKPQQPYKRNILETFKDFPSSSLPLIETLLAIDPNDRGTASSALNSEVSDCCGSVLYLRCNLLIHNYFLSAVLYHWAIYLWTI